jgi:hypothetical protein
VNDRLQVLPAGRPSVNPSLLLTPEGVDEIVDYVGPGARVIVFDVPLTERIAELGLVAERVDAVVLVIRSRLTRTEERRVGENITALGVRPSGVVVVRTGFFARLFHLTPKTPNAFDPTDDDEMPEADLSVNHRANGGPARTATEAPTHRPERDAAHEPLPEPVADQSAFASLPRRQLGLARHPSSRARLAAGGEAPPPPVDAPGSSNGHAHSAGDHDPASPDA